MLTLRQKIAQMIIMGFDSLDANENSTITQWLKQDGLGGVLLFDVDFKTKKQGKNLQTKTQIKALINQLNHYSHEANNALPLFVAIDYEGGAVDRLSNIPDCMPTLAASEQGLLSKEALSGYASQMALTLSELGFNLNFAPVVDLNLNESKGIIGRLGRSFSDNAEDVSIMAELFVQAFVKQNIACAYKHFPGHGSAIGDTHEECVDVTETFQPEELVPFGTLAGRNDSPVMIMTAHVVNRQLDSSGLPATLSYTMLTSILRERLGFQGVIVSDDLQMNAISHHYSLQDSLRLTINAGADMIIFGNQLGEISPTVVIDAIEDLVTKGEIPATRITEAFERISALKHLVLM